MPRLAFRLLPQSWAPCCGLARPLVQSWTSSLLTVQPAQSAAVPGGSSDDSDCMLPAKLRSKESRHRRRTSAVEAAIAGYSSAESLGGRLGEPPTVALFEKVTAPNCGHVVLACALR